MTRNESLRGSFWNWCILPHPPSLVELCAHDIEPRKSTGAYSLFIPSASHGPATILRHVLRL